MIEEESKSTGSSRKQIITMEDGMVKTTTMEDVTVKTTTMEDRTVKTKKDQSFTIPHDQKQTISSKLQVHVLKDSTKKNYRGLCWTIQNYIMNTSKRNLVYCDTTKTKETGDVSSSDKKKVNDNDTNDNESKADDRQIRQYKLIQEEVEDFLQTETPVERLQRSFTKNEITKTYNPDIEVYRKGLKYAVSVVSFCGFFLGCREGQDGFVRRNRFTLYTYPKAMYRRMLDSMVRVGFKYLIKANFKVLGFLVPAMALEKSITVYRNRTSPLHFAAGFGISGSLTALLLGAKGMVFGLISGTYGLVFGSCYYVISSSIGFDQETLNRKAVYNLIEQKRSYRRPAPVTNIPTRSANANDGTAEEGGVD